MSISKVWNGSVWTTTFRTSVWNGTSWSTVSNFATWNGTNWVKTDLDSPLDTQIVTPEYPSGSFDYGFGSISYSYSGYSSTGQGFYTVPFGAISDGTSNIYAGAAITDLYTDDIGQTLNLVITGATNSGWTSMYVNSASFNRADATFSSGSWLWTSVNTNIWTNPTTTIKFI